MHKSKQRTVLILGSGALKIGQAGEFDYSGSQAIKALKEDKIRTILINPNIATIQTSDYMADKLYLLPLTADFVEKVIEKERPDGLMLSFGGQTALNLGVALHDSGVLEKWNVNVLGTPVEAIKKTEDRDLFAKVLHEIDLKTPRSVAVTDVPSALAAAKDLGYPIMVRSAYALGGEGSGIARAEKDLNAIATAALRRTQQILVEEYLEGWKEVEYEVVRDRFDNCITVCNMENLDPMGIHTGESIVIAPSQTLTNSEYHKLREISIRLIRRLGIIGECNVQFGLDPHSEDYRIIEVNARLSRSSALASKATGYPLAYMAAKLALGYSLPNLRNPITKVTSACFEPALDYVVVKFPRWDLNKFKVVSRRIGSEMKSVGEVMAIGRTFEEALQKSIRMLQVGMKGLTGNKLSFVDLNEVIANPTDMRIFALAEALGRGDDLRQLGKISGIDPWFLSKIKGIMDFAAGIPRGQELPHETMRAAKRLGFSDYQIGLLVGKSEREIRERRKAMGITPVAKQIDTLAGEFPAKTNYMYLTYSGQESDRAEESGAESREQRAKSKEQKTTDEGRSDIQNSPSSIQNPQSVIVLGSGAYRIGSSVEFDWCSVNTVLTLGQLGYKPIVINYNPETVSTDYDICDKLYFEELSFERVQDIYDIEQPAGMIVSVGGQIPNDLAIRCHEAGMTVLGTSPESIDTAENRHKFSMLLDRLGVDQPEWKELTKIEEVKCFARKAGYPVLVRPSYVLSGAAMNVVFEETSLEKYLTAAADVSPEHPVVVTKFLTHAKEIEIDAVAKDGKLLVWAILEHVEDAGVHSGDATLVLPPQKTYLETVRRVRLVTARIAEALRITGPFNIQFLAKENEVKVIECNLRASRSLPFVTKVFKTNFIDVATRAIMDAPLTVSQRSSLELDYVGVKASQFSFSRLKGADPTTGVEMSSTGEVGCLGADLHDAFLKALLSTGFNLPKKNILVSVSGDEHRFEIMESVQLLKKLGYELFATEHTRDFYKQRGIETRLLYKLREKTEPNVGAYLAEGKIDLVISMPGVYGSDYGDTYEVRRMAVDYAVPLLNNPHMVKMFVNAIAKKSAADLEVKAWQDY
ncbi:MAG: carbamoyl-phosphate synthase large subunit [Planctomycetota bacterium]|nr:carbamoyl-phosphate synthase large subunit [Planctomycetota bacterium]